MNKEFLKNYIDSASPVGFEMLLGGQKVWINEASKYAQVDTDNYGSALAIYGKCNTESGYVVVLDAHCDEVSWLVSSIDKTGFLKVIPNGGSDCQIAPSMRVNVWGTKGKVDGIFGHPAIHVKDRPEKVEIKNLFIDVGARTEAEVAELGIEIGSVITYKDGYMELGNNFITGRSLDDKIGGYINIEVLRRLHENDIYLPFKLVVVNSVQEEIGLRGAAMAARKLTPSAAFIIDVTHDTVSPAYKDKANTGGDGVVLSVAPAVHNNLLSFVKTILKEKEIKFKMAACSTSTGTNTDSYTYPNGTPSVLFSLPLGYMHTTVETVHKDDIEATIEGIYNTVIRIEENQEFKYK
jgi:putative aminopeptidase FrvX